MKNLSATCLVAGLLFGLVLNAQQPTSITVKTKGGLQGAYAMLKQVVNDGKKDSLMQVEQQKIYTDRYMMYAHRLPGDSLAEYGIGTYTFENGKVVEDVFFTSGSGAQNNQVELDISQSTGGYTQVIHYPVDDQGISYTLTEEYKTVSRPLSTPIDGAWKQTKSTYIPKTGNISVNSTPTQFKVFESGYFIWANTIQDSASHKPLSFFGYGTFDMKGNEIIENNTHSSFAADVIGKPVTLKIQFKGNDSYTQTIVWPDGGRSVEVYQRMK